MTAYFGCWICGCSDIERAPDEIPDRCPTHGDGLIVGNDGRCTVEVDAVSVTGYGIRAHGEVTG